MQLDRRSPVLLGHRIEEQVELSVRTGEAVAGLPLPAQRRFAQPVGVSTLALQKALQRVQDRGHCWHDRERNRRVVFDGRTMTTEERDAELAAVQRSSTGWTPSA